MEEVLLEDVDMSDGDLDGEAGENTDSPVGDSTKYTMPSDWQDVNLDAQYLSEMLLQAGITTTRAYRVLRLGTTASRVVLVASNGQLFCTCADSSSCGIPCRHIWAVIARGEWFNMSSINRRWIRDVSQSKGVEPLQINAPLFAIPAPSHS
ncbi:unnamed protein product, partial [Tilletia laevis]